MNNCMKTMYLVLGFAGLIALSGPLLIAQDAPPEEAAMSEQAVDAAMESMEAVGETMEEAAEAVDEMADTVLSGEVVSVDLGQWMLVVQVTDAETQTTSEQTVSFSDQTQIVKGGGPAQASDLTAGDQVTIVLTTDDTGAKTASLITVETAGAE